MRLPPLRGSIANVKEMKEPFAKEPRSGGGTS
jgi:hypothetical protein